MGCRYVNWNELPQHKVWWRFCCDCDEYFCTMSTGIFFFNVQYLLFAREDSVLGSHLVLFLMPLLQDLREKYALNYVCTSNSEITENSNPLKEAKK